MTYPLKLRKKVFATKQKFNLTFEQTSVRFDIPIRTLFRWSKQIEPQKNRNKPATKLDMEGLKKDVEIYPDAYQRERATRLEVAESTIRDGLKRLGISYKKNTTSPKGRRKRENLLS